MLYGSLVQQLCPAACTSQTHLIARQPATLTPVSPKAMIAQLMCDAVVGDIGSGGRLDAKHTLHSVQPLPLS